MNRSRLLGASAAFALFAGSVGSAHAAGGTARSELAPKAWWLRPAAAAALGAAQGNARGAAIPAQAGETRSGVAPAETSTGVLTRRGMLVIEPSIEYQHSDVNRFSVGGVAILDTVLVGSIEATQADRDSVTGTLAFRYGITDRLEAELRVPYMYRDDTVTNTVISGNQTGPQTTTVDGHGIGDVEAAIHYQATEGVGWIPASVANLRVKSPTGTGPFDVERNAQGIEQELATGSGFWGVEPSVTVIAPSDPAVFYANLGYLWNVKKSVDETIANNRLVSDVDPGDAVRFGAGMGIALNEKVSFSIGYQHDWIMATKTTLDTGEVESEPLSVGSLNFGVNWQATDRTSFSVSVSAGVTQDAPDVRMMARLPIALQLF